MEQIRDINGNYTGICKYCGQVVAFTELLPGEDANGTAARLCDCKQGRAYDLMRKEEAMERERRERCIRDARDTIEAMFGPGVTRYGIGLPVMNEETRGHLSDLVAGVYDEIIEKVSISSEGIVATMRKTTKGNIKVTRKDTQEISHEVAI